MTDAGSTAPAPTDGAQISEQARKALLDEGRKAATAELTRKFGLTDKADPEAFKRAMHFAQRLTTHRSDVEREVIAGMLANPDSAAALRALISGHGNGHGPGAAVETVEQEPAPFIQTEAGVAVNPAWTKWNRDQIRKDLTAEFTKEIAPLKQGAEELRTQREREELQRQIHAHTSKTFNYLNTLPEFTANQKEIAAAFKASTEAFESGAEPWPSPDGLANLALVAYNTVVHPKLASSAHAKVQADLKLKAQGRTASPNGNGKSSVTVKDKPEGERLRAALKEQLVDPVTGRFR